MASHAIHANIAVLEATKAEGRKRRPWSCATSDIDYINFEGVIEDVIREFRFSDNHVHLIRQRLEQTVAIVSPRIPFQHSAF